MNRRRIERLVQAQERVLKAKKADVAAAQGELLRAMREEDHAVAEQRALRSNLCEPRNWEQHELMLAAELLAAGDFAQRAAQATRVERAKVLEAAQQQYRRSDQQAKTYDKIREKVVAGELQQQGIREQRTLDEVASRTGGRRED